MIGLLCVALTVTVLVSPFKSKLRPEVESGASTSVDCLEAQAARSRPAYHDCWFPIQLYRWVPSILQDLTMTHDR
jgi:hypothetical protein